MATASFHEPVRSLASADAGESLHVRRILFGALRALCADLGVHEGDVVRCRAGTPSNILLETAKGRIVALERDWARFIQVSDAIPAPEPAPELSMSVLRPIPTV
jgi:hypothetical protein